MTCRKPLVQWLHKTRDPVSHAGCRGPSGQEAWGGPSRDPGLPGRHLQGRPCALSERGLGLAPGKCCGFCGCFDNPAIPDRTRPGLGFSCKY